MPTIIDKEISNRLEENLNILVELSSCVDQIMISLIAGKYEETLESYKEYIVRLDTMYLSRNNIVRRAEALTKELKR